MPQLPSARVIRWRLLEDLGSAAFRDPVGDAEPGPPLFIERPPRGERSGHQGFEMS